MVKFAMILSGRIANYYRKNELLDEETIQKMEYTIKSFINEFSKFLMLFLIFLFLDKHIHFLWCYFAFVSLRLFSGGIHCNTYWSCFAVSLFSFLIFIFVPELINLNSKILFQSVALSVISPLVFSPVLPKVRKIKKRKIIVLLKTFSVIITMMWIVLCYYLIDGKYINSILIALLLGNIQLIFPVIMDKRRKERRI